MKLKKKILCVTKLKGHIECGKITSMLLQYGKKKCAARKKIAKALLQYVASVRKKEMRSSKEN